MCGETGGIWELSVPFIQFCCDHKISLKIKYVMHLIMGEIKHLYIQKPP